MPRSGHWKVESKSDPRFNLEGRGEFRGGYPIRMPDDVLYGIRQRADELNTQPPEDLEFQFDRDPSSKPPAGSVIAPAVPQDDPFVNGAALYREYVGEPAKN